MSQQIITRLKAKNKGGVDMPKFYTPQEIAEMLKVTDKTVRNWIRSGELDAVVVGKSYRIPEESIKKLIQKCEVNKNE